MSPEQQQAQAPAPEQQPIPQAPLVTEVDLPKSMIRGILKEEELTDFQVAKPAAMAAAVTKATRFAPVFAPAGVGESAAVTQMAPVNAGETPYEVARKTRVLKNQGVSVPPDFHEQAMRRLRMNQQGAIFGGEFRPSKPGQVGGIMGGMGGEEWIPEAEPRAEFRGLGQVGATLANTMSLGYTGRFTNDWVSEFRQQYDTGNGFLNFLQFDAAAMAGSLALFNSPVGVFTPTGAAWSAGTGAVKAAGALATGSQVPSWVVAGARMRMLKPLYQGRWAQQMLAGQAKLQGPGKAVAKRFGKGALGQIRGEPMQSKINPIDWAAKYFGWRAARSVSPRLYQRLSDVLRQSGGEIVNDGKTIFVPEGKYYGYVKRIMQQFKARAGKSSVRLEITHTRPIGPERSLEQSIMGVQAKATFGAARASLARMEGAAGMVGGATATGAAWGAANPQDYQTGEEYWAGEKISRGTAMERGVKEGLKFTGGFVGGMALGRAALGPASSLMAQAKYRGKGPGPQKLFGAETGPKVEGGEVVVRPAPDTSQTTPRQSLHNATPEPPRVRMPLAETSEYGFRRVTGKDGVWLPKAEFEALMLAHPELEPMRAELERKRMIVEQLEMVGNNMDEGAGQAGAEGAPDASSP